MTELPELQANELAALIDSLFARKRDRRSRLLAVLGTSEASRVQTKVGEFTVVPVHSEVELRRALPRFDVIEDARLVFLVPWDELPLDISGRFAGHGRVQTLPRQVRLRHILDAGEIDSSVWDTALAGYILRRPPSDSLGLTGRVTGELLWTHWLAATWKAPRDMGLPAILAWAANDHRGPECVALLALPEASGVRDDLLRFLEQRLGVVGPVIWSAWEGQQGKRLLAFAVLCEALVDQPQSHVWLRLVGKRGLGRPLEATVFPRLAGLLRAGVGLALADLERREGPAGVAEVLREAESLLSADDDPAIRPLIITSPRLESAWKLRLAALGDALFEALARPLAESVQAVEARLKELLQHELYKQSDALAINAQAEMASHLAAWLVDRSDRRLIETPSNHAPVESLARWYTEEGGYIDWARRKARPAASRPGRFGEAVNAVLAAADAARRELDLRFARALPEWYQSNRPSQQVLPIDKAAETFAVSFLAESSERRLLVLILDGMAWAQAVELLESLGERTTPWAPLRWLARKVGDGPFPPVLASIPTTDISRSAFFAGKSMATGKEHSAVEDPRRWQQHTALRRVLPAAPRLLLRAEGQEPDASLSREAQALIEREDERIVSMVLNVIDRSLGGDPQHEYAWKVESISCLPLLLEAARASKRAVLLVSDHGHVAGDHLQRIEHTYPRSDRRWRPLDADGFDPEFEVVFTGQHVWAPPGADGVVVIADDRHSYSAQRTWGEYGGATLAEVVAPLLLIGWEGMEQELQDPGLALRPAQQPRWWHFEVARPPEQAPPERPTSRPRKRDDLQTLSLLPDLQPTPPRPAPSKPEPRPSAAKAGFRDLTPVVQALAKSDEFKARAEKSRHSAALLAAVDYLLERQGLAPLAAFANALAIEQWRVQQTITIYAELLNVDGEPILQYDPRGQQVRLDRDKLAICFGIKI